MKDIFYWFSKHCAGLSRKLRKVIKGSPQYILNDFSQVEKLGQPIPNASGALSLK